MINNRLADLREELIDLQDESTEVRLAKFFETTDAQPLEIFSPNAMRKASIAAQLGFILVPTAVSKPEHHPVPGHYFTQRDRNIGKRISDFDSDIEVLYGNRIPQLAITMAVFGSYIDHPEIRRGRRASIPPGAPIKTEEVAYGWRVDGNCENNIAVHAHSLMINAATRNNIVPKIYNGYIDIAEYDDKWGVYRGDNYKYSELHYFRNKPFRSLATIAVFGHRDLLSTGIEVSDEKNFNPQSQTT